MIVDGLGNEVTYWPISGLKVGDDSEVLHFYIESDGEGQISAGHHAALKIWCKRVDHPSYTDISVTPIDLATMDPGSIEFLIYVECVGPISGFERIPTTVTVGTSSSAGWVL